MAISKVIALSAALWLALVFAVPASADTPHAAVECQINTQPQEVTDAWAEFKRTPNELEAQLKAADALINQGCYKEAVPVLEAGLQQRPRSSELQSRLRAARSMLSEEHFFEGLGNAQEAAKFQHSQMRCTKLADVGACDEALRTKPDDPQLVISKGDALAHGGRPAEAILVYLHAQELLPGDASVKGKLAAAESQREGLVLQCEGGADAAAADACQAALLRGSADEFTLLRRKGILLQSVDKPAPALDAFIAANVLKQGDKSVALAIVALTDSTGRKDALALAARGSALLTLGRATEALQALRQAEVLAPALPGIKTQVAQAEQASRKETKRQIRTAGSRPSGTVKPPIGGAAAESGSPGDASGSVAAGASAAAAGKVQPGARVATSSATNYSNDASAAHTN